MKRNLLFFALLFVASALMAQVKVDISNTGSDMLTKKNAVSAGYGMGGLSYLGIDFERMIGDKLAVQAGIGIAGYGVQMNYHFKADIRSSFINIGYWQQGFGYYWIQDMIGATFAFRAKKIFQAQLGVGYRLNYDIYNYDLTDWGILIAAGAYFPF